MDRTFTCCLLHLWWVPIFDYLYAHENFLTDRISERERNVTVKAPSSPFLTVVIDRLMEARRTRAISLRRELHEATRNEDDLTAHPDNQTIGSKDEVPAFVEDKGSAAISATPTAKSGNVSLRGLSK